MFSCKGGRGKRFVGGRGLRIGRGRYGNRGENVFRIERGGNLRDRWRRLVGLEKMVLLGEVSFVIKLPKNLVVFLILSLDPFWIWLLLVVTSAM